MSTREGFTWTPQGGLKAGLPCIGAINPPEHKLPVEDHSVFDVIVIGAGYTGLVATRDLATQGSFKPLFPNPQNIRMIISCRPSSASLGGKRPNWWPNVAR
jgi:hypothetical protein